MTRLTILLLILLRLAIGWHLSYEGWKKVQKGAFTSEDYLRESTGPLAPYFHDLAGDPLADRLTAKPAPAEPGPANRKESFPPALAREWDAWFDRFVSHYELTDEQKEKARTALDQRKSAFVHWLETSTHTRVKESPYGPPVALEETVAERVKAYRAKQQEIRDFIAHNYRQAAGTRFEPEAKTKLTALRREAAGLRDGLRENLQKQTDEMQKTVTSVLTEEQWEKPLVSYSVRPGLFQRSLLGWIDFAVTAALLVFGVCLMLGLCTRTTGVLAALLLLSFYLAMPPLPGLPEPPQAEGNYLFVNKNLIEVLALLLLASVAAGQWFGLDGAIRAYRARRKARSAERRAPSA